jgi:hypothetical protein
MKPNMIGAAIALAVLAGCASTQQTGSGAAGARSSEPPAALPAAPTDVASIDGIVGALYDVISGPVGQPRDWDRMRSLFHPDGKLIPTGRTSAGQHVVRPMTVEEYISGSGAYLEEVGFREVELVRHVDRFGNIAQVFSSYAGYRDGEEQPFVRGINSIQLYNDDIRWWVMNVFWEPEGPGVPLPPRYEGAGGASEPRADG